MTTLRTRHGEIALPAFLPDATRGCIRTLDAGDVAASGVQGLVVNAYHLMLRPGARLIQSLGGIHQFMNWHRPVLVDSGGFQVFSLIRQRPNLGTIRQGEVIFRSPYDGDKTVLTPRKSIEVQHHLGADIMMCLDDCTHAEEGSAQQAQAVDRTIRWARECRETFDALYNSSSPQRRRERGETIERSTSNIQHPTSNERGTTEPGTRNPEPERATRARLRRPLLFGIVQGGADLDLRRRCAEALIELDFDGYGLGGWPLDSKGNLLTETLGFVADLLPADRPRYAMGIGKPENVVACARMGYDLFDCVIPTRDARHHHVFAFVADWPEALDLDRPAFYEKLNLLSGRFARDGAPISSICDCACCRSYSRAYLRHLFQVKDLLGSRLSTIHNLRFYTMLMERLRDGAA